MEKVAYFDCFAGICGNMVLGAMVDAGLGLECLRQEIAKLDIDGYEITHEKVKRGALTGSRVSVKAQECESPRHLADIKKIITGSGISDRAKKLSVRIFEDLAGAEARIHNIAPGKVHFHEVGAIDSVIDIVGTSIGIDELGIEKVFSSKVHLGNGFVDCMHGTIPVPAPATLELLKGAGVYSTGVNGEMVTPTGAAILKNVAESFGNMPEMTIETTGYGAGDKDLGLGSLFRIVIGRGGK